MKLAPRLFPILVVLAVIGIVAWAAKSPLGGNTRNAPPVPTEGFAAVLERVDLHFQNSWKQQEITSSEPAGELLILRRLSLSLCGTIPSLEEIRAFENDDQPDRIDRWTARMMADPRFADYFAERLARSYVGTGEGAFLIFRRDRFVNWLSTQLKQRRPYNEIVHQLISEQGFWTGKPATNFVTAAFANDKLDENKLAARCVRAFLGQRMDCAQCHDHPFDDWTQEQFAGMAAFFGQAKISIPVGVEDKRDLEFSVRDPDATEERTVAPDVPFHREWLSEESTRRVQFADWITHRENRRFERAIANRVWGLLFGKPFHVPLDDLPNPDDPEHPELKLLDILGDDFREHGYDLRRLIHVIVASKPFRMASTHSTEDENAFDRLNKHWAVFPLTRLRPEQIIGSMLQSASITTIDQNSHLLVRTIRFFRENDFVEEYGDLGEYELEERAGTIPQALLRMNGNLPNEVIKANPLSASGRIAAFAGTDRKCLETCYLVALSRRPTQVEQQHFLAQLGAVKKKQRIVEDIFWSLFNSPEFSWNH